MRMLTSVVGENFHFANHTYDYMGMAPRTFNSIDEVAIEAGISRIYAGIHYRGSTVKGRAMGVKVAENILARVKFLKE